LKRGFLKRGGRGMALTSRRNRRESRSLALVVSLGVAVWLQAGYAATLSPTQGGDDEIPPLQPPRGEIPPGFWEQHGPTVIGSAVLVLAGTAAGFAWWRRPRPAGLAPPETLARQELEPLRGQPETGMLLSRVSSALRHYVRDAFRLGVGEWTTAEVAQALQQCPEAGPELGTRVVELLRQCDERKFAPAPQGPPLNAAARALELIAAAEARRAELARMAAPAQGSTPAKA